MALRAVAHDAGVRLELDLGADLAVDVEDLPPAELAALERDLVIDVRLAVGLSRTLRNRRMRERGRLAS